MKREDEEEGEEEEEEDKEDAEEEEKETAEEEEEREKRETMEKREMEKRKITTDFFLVKEQRNRWVGETKRNKERERERDTERETERERGKIQKTIECGGPWAPVAPRGEAALATCARILRACSHAA